MNDVQHLRELILGLAILSPMGCQSPPASPDPDPAVEQRGQEPAASPDPEPVEQRGREATEAAPMEEVVVGDPDASASAARASVQRAAEVAEGRAEQVRLAIATSQVTQAYRNASEPLLQRRRQAALVAKGVAQTKKGVVKEMMSWQVPELSPQDDLASRSWDPDARCLSAKQVYAIQKEIYDEELAAWKEYEEQSKTSGQTSRKFAVPRKPTKPSRKVSVCPEFLTTRRAIPGRCSFSGGVHWRFEGKLDDGAMMCCYSAPSPTGPRRPCGRLFYVEEQATRAKVQGTRGWMGADVEAPRAFGEEASARAACAWLEDALEEHASIAAFSRATLELMALGAPSELLAEYQRACLDEIRHARACFSLVAALTGEDVSADRIAVEGPREDLDAIIADVFWGGCVGESVAALCAQRALRGCEWEAARAALEQISEDEARHAALAWSTLSFFGEVEPERVRRVLEAVEVPRRDVAADEEVDEAWVALGRLTPEQEARAEADAWEHLILPMRDALLADA